MYYVSQIRDRLHVQNANTPNEKKISSQITEIMQESYNQEFKTFILKPYKMFILGQPFLTVLSAL